MMSARLSSSVFEYALSRQLRSARQLAETQPNVFSSGIEVLDEAFAGTVRAGHIIEWGIPRGRNGRRIPLLFLREQALPAVWVYGDPELRIYAPAWASFGIDLQKLFYIRSEQPVQQLRPLFVDDSFKIIVLDAPRKLSRGDIAFISQQARYNRQLVFIIRHYFLSAGRGTAQAAMRVNCWQNTQGDYQLHFIKGKQISRLSLQPKVVLHDDH
mgnify:FL=1